MAQIKHIFLITGEASGDMQAAGLASRLIELNPGIKISAVGAQLLKKAGCDVFYESKELAVMGFFDVLRKLPRFFALKALILRKIKTEKPDCIILVDFSGFNLRLAKAINKKIPVIYYISPQVWASRVGRLKTIRKFISKMIVLFEFEKDFYRRHGINVDFVGHPLLDIVKPSLDKEEFLRSYGLSQNKNTIALLPGSRKSEIRNVLPVMLKSAMNIQNGLGDVQFIVAKSTQVPLELYNKLLAKTGLAIKIVEGKTYDCLNVADFALVCSGTATLETAILKTPFFIVYKMNILNYLLYRPQVKIPYIGLVNIISGRKIIPEFIQLRAKAPLIARLALKLLKSPLELQQMQNNLSQIKAGLGEPGASLRAAGLITDYLSRI